LSFIEKTATKPDMVKRATALLDQTEQAANFQEITQTIEKELKAEQSAPAARTPAPPAPRRVQETVLEEITPIAPAVQGEKITGLLINLDCADGLTLRIRTDRATTDLHSSEPQKIQFLSYTSTVSNDIKCGARNPGEPVTVTYKPNPGGGGEPLVVEFQEKK
jgi:hypothetical protein